MIQPGMVIPFNGREIDIPAGWVRDHRFDGRLPKHSPTGKGAVSGSSTHVHDENHLHVLANHTHATSFAANAIDSTLAARNIQNAPKVAICQHTHQSVTSGNATDLACSDSLESQTQESVTSAGSSIPASYSVIYIKATKINILPAGGIVFRENTQTSLSRLTSANAKFLIGAATGSDAGENVGSNHHQHTWSHTHTNTHSHTGVNSGTAPAGVFGVDNHSITYGGWNHYHPVTYQASTVTLAQATCTTPATDESIPPFHQLFVYQALKPSPVSSGDIAICVDDVPPGWEIISRDEFYVQGSGGQTLTSGGSEQHTHTNVSHVHAATAHTHQATTGQESSSVSNAGRSQHDTDGYLANQWHTHDVTVAESSLTSSAAFTSLGRADNDPPTITVKYVRATNRALGGGGASALKKLM